MEADEEVKRCWAAGIPATRQEGPRRPQVSSLIPTSQAGAIVLGRSFPTPRRRGPPRLD